MFSNVLLTKKIEQFSTIFTLYLIYLQIQQQIYGQMGIQLYDLVENIVGKGEIARYKQFLLFPQCFQKLSVVDASKWVSME